MFGRDPKRVYQGHAAGDAYYDDLDVRNLLFGAGISGTTTTLLASAFAFAYPLGGEQLKQYVFAIIGYLVGGGMHSYHESLAVAQKAGLPYTPGAYIPSLPESFLESVQFKDWAAKYYDIVYLGATHWRYNANHLPSHVVRQQGISGRPKLSLMNDFRKALTQQRRLVRGLPSDSPDE